MDINLKQYNKIGIMGGTFDPIHNQHLFIANSALQKLNLDIVLFIPTGKVPHKDNIHITNKIDRYNMTALAINNNEKFFISDIEINNDNTCYSFETLQKIKERTDAELYFIIGMDTLYSLHTWRNLDIVSNLCKLVTFKRPNYEDSKENKIALEKHNFEIHNIDDVSISISSTDVREKLQKGESVKYLIPDNVIDYINNHNLFTPSFSDEYLDNLTSDLKNTISEKRYNHTMSVLTLTKELALKYGVDARNAEICALLHDFAKEMTDKEIIDYANKNNIYLDGYTKENLHIAHGLIASNIAEKKYKVYNKDMLNAISFHTTGRENMTILEKIIFLADKLEPTRHYKELDELTKLAFSDIDMCMLKSIENIMKFRGDDEAHALSIVTLYYYEKLIQERKYV